MHRPAVDLAVDAEVVVQDRVGADGVDADLVVHALQRRPQLEADLAAAGEVGAQQLAEPLAADHRLPGPGEGLAVGTVSTDTETSGAGPAPVSDAAVTASPTTPHSVTVGTEATA